MYAATRFAERRFTWAKYPVVRRSAGQSGCTGHQSAAAPCCLRCFPSARSSIGCFRLRRRHPLRATVDRDGFGGHTPLFNAFVWDRGNAAAHTLDRGARKDSQSFAEVSSDWTNSPLARVRNVTAASGAADFTKAGLTRKACNFSIKPHLLFTFLVESGQTFHNAVKF